MLIFGCGGWGKLSTISTEQLSRVPGENTALKR